MSLLPRFNAAMEKVRDAEKIGRILRETGDPGPVATVSRATLPGDTRRLRGIPCVARGVPGLQPGSSPHAIRREHYS